MSDDSEARSDLNQGSLQSETLEAPESAWFFAWLKSAMLYLAVVTTYLGSVIGLVAAWKNFVAEQGEAANITTYAMASVLALPLLFGLLFNLLPTLRRRRERGLRPVTDGTGRTGATYFQTSPRAEDPHGFFAKGYEAFLEWTRQPKAPLLHLTGLSGSGKSSLISAYLEPHLKTAEGGQTTVLTIRSYHDPLEALKESLLPLWKKEPEDYAGLTPLEAVRRASRQVEGTDRLLIVFDQFEEFFLLRANLPEVPQQAVNVTARDLAPLKAFFDAFLADPPEDVTLLLSYREDHKRLLEPLELPSRQERLNWMTVDPFDFTTATAFLRSCPGLFIPQDRMDRVLREAARQEGGRVVMRPIVANLLGLVLRQMSGHPTLWRRKSDLLRGYVRDTLGIEMQEERERILRAMLTDFHTARPRSVAEVAKETGMSAGDLDSQLEHLGRSGLVRCLTPEERVPAKRVWQVAHDFLATLIERVLDAMQRALWRTARPWLAPGAAVLAAGVLLVHPWIQKHQDIRALAEAGFTWNEERREIAVGSRTTRVKSLSNLNSIFRRLNPLSILLISCDLTDLDCLKGLTNLEYLYIRECNFLRNVEGLHDIASLESVDINYCGHLNLTGLSGLPNLRKIQLNYCSSVSIDEFRDLPALQSLEIQNCEWLLNADALGSFQALKYLTVSYCESAIYLDFLPSLADLLSLDVRQCQNINNIASLNTARSLQYLNIEGCSLLHNLDPIQGLKDLRTLDISRCENLVSLNGLEALPAIENIDLSHCSKLRDITSLKNLPKIAIIILQGNTNLQKNDLENLKHFFPGRKIVMPDDKSHFDFPGPVVPDELDDSRFFRK